MKKDNYWIGFLTGFLAAVVTVMLVMIITTLTGVLNWQRLFFGSNASVITASLEKKLLEIEGLVDRYYLDEIDDEVMGDAICTGLMTGLEDTYAAYYNESAYQDMKEKTNGNYCGIGAYVSQNATTGAVTITQPIEGGPAKKAGILAGDIIVKIDGESVEGDDLSSVVSKMKGEEDTTVDVTVRREGEEKLLTFTLKRKEIESQTVASKMLDDDIGYIQVTSFEEVTKKQFRNAVASLEKKGEKGLVIDLRDNGGGVLKTAVDMLDRMLPKGVVVYTLDKNGKKTEYKSSDEESFDKPIAILVNGNSASASEVFAGALQDYGKAELIGTTTFGKGIVQSLFDLSDGTAIKLTTAKYYTPLGRNIHGTGLEPDISVEYDDTATTQAKSGVTIDNQLQTAIDYLTKK